MLSEPIIFDDIETQKPRGRKGVRSPIPRGTKFGKWEVTGDAQRLRNTRIWQWPCRCECGFETYITGGVLRYGASTQCRTCADKYAPKLKPEDLSGQTFGGWFVISEVPIHERPDVQRIWKSRCKCGFESILTQTQLRNSKIGCKKCSNVELGATIRRFLPYEAMYNNARGAIVRNRSGRQSYEFSISYEEFVEICETRCCHYCHVPLSWARFNGPTSSGPENKGNRSYKLDRKDNNLGYISGNVVGCCKRCNYGKGGSYSYAEWFMMTECFRDGRLKATSEVKTKWGSNKKGFKRLTRL
jgi:hypothetical protein